MYVIVVLVPHLFGQYRWIPEEVKTAIQHNTRTWNGTAGEKGWINRARYRLSATLDTAHSMLSGSGSVTYFNESGDTLRWLVIRLYQDFYKKGNRRDWNIAPDDITNGVEVNDFKVNGKTAKLPGKAGRYYFGTNRRVRLKKPLLPGDSALLSFRWRFHVPETTRNRMGNYGKGRYFISYWYPQVAVYDDISGWDNIEFTGITEFYNDFNDYDVTLTVPGGYAVWATGKLQNGRELFTPEIVRRIANAEKSDKIVHIITADDWKKKRVLKEDAPLRWHFRAKHVPDFSFAAMPSYLWDASSVMVDSVSRRRILVDAVYPEHSRSFRSAARYARMSIIYMSNRWPGVPYPYEHMTSVANGTPNGGMETPMMADDGDPKDTLSCAGLVFHEISHSYFPFFMGTNEKKYAWMDEGWAAYFTGVFLHDVFGDKKYFPRTVNRFNGMNGDEMEVPLMYPSNFISNFGYYRMQAYTRSSLAYKFLREAMGDSLFALALHRYMQRWNGKHPTPYDFFNTFMQTYGDDLFWFINPWFFDKATADLGITKVTRNNRIVVNNAGGLPLPVHLTCIYSDGSSEVLKLPVGAWKNGVNAVVLQADTAKQIVTVVLGDSEVPDINTANNRFEMEP